MNSTDTATGNPVCFLALKAIYQGYAGELDVVARNILCALLVEADEQWAHDRKPVSIPSRRLAAMAGCSRSTMYERLIVLTDAGYIHVTHSTKNHIAATYRILDKTWALAHEAPVPATRTLGARREGSANMAPPGARHADTGCPPDGKVLPSIYSRMGTRARAREGEHESGLKIAETGEEHDVDSQRFPKPSGRPSRARSAKRGRGPSLPAGPMGRCVAKHIEINPEFGYRSDYCATFRDLMDEYLNAGGEVEDILDMMDVASAEEFGNTGTPPTWMRFYESRLKRMVKEKRGEVIEPAKRAARRRRPETVGAPDPPVQVEESVERTFSEEEIAAFRAEELAADRARADRYAAEHPTPTYEAEQRKRQEWLEDHDPRKWLVPIRRRGA